MSKHNRGRRKLKNADVIVTDRRGDATVKKDYDALETRSEVAAGIWRKFQEEHPEFRPFTLGEFMEACSFTADPRERLRCRDCAVLEGELHQPGCDQERCPFCLGQLITCDCCYQLLGIDSSPGTWAYENGLTEDQEAEWDRRLEARGRVRFVVAPNLCARCGRVWPPMFMVDDWKDVIPADLQGQMLCRACYETVKGFVLTARAQECRSGTRQ